MKSANMISSTGRVPLIAAVTAIAVMACSDIGVSRILVPLFALGPDPVAGVGKLAEDIVGKL